MKKNREIEIITGISKILIKNFEPAKLVPSLFEEFSKNIPLYDFRILIWNSEMNSFKDFSKTWEKVQNDDEGKLLNVFSRFKNNLDSYLLNDLQIEFNEEFNEIPKIRLKKENSLYFPLINKKTQFGLIEFKFEKLKDISGLLIALQVASYQISVAILNNLMNERAKINADFYEAMKNISQIIENQYELVYIVPLIGEMIDRFISNHLIYIFLKDENNNFNLVWPNACHDKIILNMLKTLNASDECVFSENKKIGIFPISAKNELIGAIVASSNIERLQPFEIEYLSQLTKQSIMTIERANTYAEVLQHATIDALTGLNNRRQFEIRLNQEVSTAKRKKHPLCCIMLDIDYFKKVNDTYGHSAGDSVLKNVAQIINSQLREYDIASRYGGEEFVILLPLTSIEEANFVAQRLRTVIEKSLFEIQSKENKKIKIPVTISIILRTFEH